MIVMLAAALEFTIRRALVHSSTAIAGAGEIHLTLLTAYQYNQ